VSLVHSRRPDDPAQTELLSRYCQEAETLLAGAADYATALRVRDELCERFEKECLSALVVNATREYLTQIISRTWPHGHDRDH
jgi:hypothetical protein